MDRFVKYIKDTGHELKQVSWPTQKQAFIYTALVLGISAVVAVYVGVFDFLFTKAIDFVINFV